MSTISSPVRSALVAALVCLVTATSSCVDAPSGLEGAGAGAGPGTWVIAPVFSLLGPGGERPMTAAQQDALAAAFDRVDRFRMVVKRASDGVVVLDTVLVVTPGQSEYDLTVPIAAKDNEEFLVTLTAMQGATTLFTAENIAAKATASGVPGSPPPAAVQIPLVYTGPGATASSVTVVPTQVVLAPGGSATLGASVRDASGSVIAGVPVSWASSSSGVATVTGSGALAGVGDGLATVTVTTPTGLAASATVYVVAGELAYVEGGTLKVRGAASGTPTDRASGGAAQPAWRADGGKLYYVAGGGVKEAGGAALLDGSWPSVSPDGTKLAVERGGTVWFANSDGTRPTLGPSGSSPVWVDAATLVVGGGSVQRVKADGTGRTTVVSGDASLPALGPDGRVAALVGGSLRVTGIGSALVTGASGRATWSPSGRWLVVATGSGLVVVPADGSAPAVALPGLAGASDPSFKPTGGLSAPPSLSLTGTNPDPPLPGGSVRLLGSGFDWIIPANNRVSWPVPGGTASAEVTAVRETYIEVVVPRSVAAGQIRVDTRTASATLGFEPKFGALEVTARTPWSTPVPGVGVALVPSGGGDRVSGSTGADGTLLLSGIVPGTYTATFSAPTGFRLLGSASQTVSIGIATSSLSLSLSPVVASVTTVPSSLALEVGRPLSVQLDVRDAAGNAIPQVTASWSSSSLELAVSGSGLSGSLSGVFAGASAGSSKLSIDIDGKAYTFPVSVTSFIAGTVTVAGVTPAPAPGVQVLVKRAGATVADLTTDAQGYYRASGLYQGTYDVTVRDAQGRVPSPSGQSVILGASSPSGSADFQLLAFSKLNVTAKTPWDAAVSGVRVTLKDAQGQTAASGETGETGTLLLDKLKPATYALQVQAPQGYVAAAGTPTSVTLSSETQTLELQLTPKVVSLKTEPESLTVEVGDGIDVSLLPLDIHGQPIPKVDKVTWTGSAELGVTGNGLTGSLSGLYPSKGAGAAKLTVTIGADQFAVGVSVTSFISGAVRTQATEATPAQGVANVFVLVRQGETTVASGHTGANGNYLINGLYAGTYTVSVTPSGELHPVPSSREVVLGEKHASGTADFIMSAGVVDSIHVSVSPEEVHALGATMQVSVEAFDSLGNPMGGRTTTYVSRSPALASVDATGKVTALANGNVWIKATVESKTDSVRVTVDQKAVTLVLKDEDGVALPDSIRTLWGEIHPLKWEAKDSRGNVIPPAHKRPSFESTDPAKVWVDTARVAHISTAYVGPADVTGIMDEATDVVRVGVHGVRAGNFNFNSDIWQMSDSLYGKIEGSVYIENAETSDLDDLITIWDIEGDLNIKNNTGIDDLAGLANVEYVGGTLRIKRNSGLTTPAGRPAAALKYVGGALKIWDNDNPGFTNADMFANLVEVGGYIDIDGNDYLEDLSGVSSLKQAYGLSLVSNESLDLDGAFPALEYLGGDGLWIDESATVARFPKLTGIDGGIGVGGEVEEVNPIQELNLPALTCVEEEIWIYDNEELETVRMPDLVSVGTSCATPFDLGDIEGVAPRTRSAASPDKDPDPTDRGMARFRGTAEARVRALDQEAKARLEQRRSARETRRIEAAREAAALRGPAGAPAVPDRPWARAARPARADKPQANGYEGGSGLLIEDNHVLTTLALGSLEEVGGPLYLYELYTLQSVDLPALQTVEEWLNIGELYSLTALDLSGLTTVGDFDLWTDDYDDGGGEAPSRSAPQRSSGPPTWTLRLTSLGQVHGYFYVGGLYNLKTLTANKLEHVEEDLTIEYLDALTSFSFTGLQWVDCDESESCVSINDNPSLTSFNMPNMFTYDFYLGYNDALATLPDLGGLATPDDESFAWVRIEGNENLTSLAGLAGIEELYGLGLHSTSVSSLSALHTTGAPLSRLRNLDLWGNSGLQTLNGLAGLVSNMSTVYISYNSALTDVTGLNNLGTGDSPNPVASTLVFEYNANLSTAAVNALFAVIEAANPTDGGGVALPSKVNVGQKVP